MKISKIYSNKKEIFEDIKFNEEFNVIFAKVKKPKDSTKDSHNLGKSLLIELIDFMFLKSFKTGTFLKENYELFEDFVFYLEIKINDGDFLTIKRGVSNNNSISLKLHNDKYQDFRNEPDSFWDKSDISFEKAREEVNNLINLNSIFPPWDYRKGITYFLRGQRDYVDVFQISKFSIGKHAYWKPYMARILGFDENLIEQKYSKDDAIAEKEKFKLQFEETVSIDPEDFDKLQGVIKIKEKEINQKELKINRFDFYEKEIELNSTLVNEIEENISEYNTQMYRINYDIDKIQEALSHKIDFNINEIKKVYEEARIYFSNKFDKDYSDLLEFNKQLFEERSKFLKEKLEESNKNKIEINNKLIDLNNKREEILSIIQDRDSFSKFRKLQAELINEKTQLINLKKELENLNHSDQIQKQIDKLIIQREDLINKTKDMIRKSNEIYETIRGNFNEIVKSIFGIPAILSIKINEEGNLEFKASFVKDEEDLIETSEDKGNTYRKLLCAAFDLSVLMAYSNKSFYRFVYHDGILESLDDRKKILFLRKVKEVCSKYGIQYILTAINHDLPRDENGNLVEFSDKEIIKLLHDDGKDGRLFKIDKF